MTTANTQRVSPEEIQRALDKIWESLETTNTTRASLFNLIFYSKKNSRRAYVQKVAQKVVEKFPSRVLFISVDDQSPEDSLKTEVSLLSTTRGDFDVACDYIQFETSGGSRSRIPFLVLPHLLPDLPIYLVWEQDPCMEDPLFDQLDVLSSRLIFDSETTENLPHFAQSILKHAAHTDIADLNWARIEDWRDLLSMVFYSEETLQSMQRACKIAISYNGKESQFFCHTRIQSIYLQAWIACQLNWEFKTATVEKEKMHFSYQSSFCPVEIYLQPTQNAQLPPGIILTLDIISSDDHTYSFSRNLEEFHRITLNSFDAHKCDLPAHYILQKAESGHSLVKEITHRGTSKHFLKVLHLLENMAI